MRPGSVGHGTGVRKQSKWDYPDRQTGMRQLLTPRVFGAVAAKREAEKIRALGRYASVLNVYMEEEPRVSDWPRLTNTPHVIAVPFFISDGLHSYEDIPALLGIGSQPKEFSSNPHHLHGRALYYASALGTDPRIADIILEQVAAFDRSDCVLPRAAPSSQAKM